MRPDSSTEPSPITPEQRRRNRRLGLILAALAVAIFIGFIARSVYFNG